MKFEIKSVERIYFNDDTPGLVLNLITPIAEIAGSMRIYTQKPTEANPNGFALVPLTMRNVTQLHVTDKVLDGNTVSLTNPKGVITIEVLYLDVSKPSIRGIEVIKPSRAWIVDVPFSEYAKYKSLS